MPKLPELAQKLLARLRRVRWPQAAAIGVAASVVGLGVWIGRDRLFTYEPPPEFAEYSQRVEDGVHLGEFLSYETVESVAAKLNAWGYTIDRSASHKPRSRRYPPRDLDSMEIIGYHHLDQRGGLRLEFFNDRLYEAHFEPDKIDGYLKRLHGSEPQLKRDRLGMSELVRGPQRIVTNIDLAASKVGKELRTRAYVIWQDLRLKQQLALWEERYSADAIRTEKD